MVRAGSFSAWTERQRERHASVVFSVDLAWRQGQGQGTPGRTRMRDLGFWWATRGLGFLVRGLGLASLACKPIKLRVPWTFQPRGGALLLVDAAQ